LFIRPKGIGTVIDKRWNCKSDTRMGRIALRHQPQRAPFLSRHVAVAQSFLLHCASNDAGTCLTYRRIAGRTPRRSETIDLTAVAETFNH